jgi:hypothetical protein
VLGWSFTVHRSRFNPTREGRSLRGLFEDEVGHVGFEIPVDHRERGQVERGVRPAGRVGSSPAARNNPWTSSSLRDQFQYSLISWMASEGVEGGVVLDPRLSLVIGVRK